MNWISDTKKLYKFALENNWDSMKKHLFVDNTDLMALLNPLTVHNDNIMHLVVHSGRTDLLKEILDCFMGSVLPGQVNSHGNTVLHEAAITGNLAVVELLVKETEDNNLLEMPNKFGETPLFRAAAFGKTKIVNYLASQQGQMDTDVEGKRKLKDIHRKREDGASVLFVAVQGKHFGTALALLELDVHLPKCEDNKRTSLYMLAKLPSALNSEYQTNIWKKLLYFCLPVGWGHNDDSDNIETEDGKSMAKIEDHKDLESGLQHKALPVGGDHNSKSKDEEKNCCLLCIKVSFKIELISIRRGLHMIYVSIWKLIISGYSKARKIWKEKRDHQFAYELAENLIRNDKSWEDSIMRVDTPPDGKNKREEAKRKIPILVAATRRKEKEKAVEYSLELYPQALDLIKHRESPEIEEEEEKRRKISLFAATSTDTVEDVEFSLEMDPLAIVEINNRKSSKVVDMEEWGTPLLAAVTTGNVKFVKLIIEECPQALEQVNQRNQNILHVAAMYRQKEIFDLVKEKKILVSRLARQFDKSGYTILHSVADTKHYTAGTHSGPAYRLKEELEWFKRVEEILPAYYTMLPDNNNKIAIAIFEKKHKDLLKEAQQWMKDTSQSCSAVAVLVATVVFAAAFTVPGGTNEENGLPILLHSPFFLFFTVMDVVSLSCSLTAVVMFLSILTSPFELDDFHDSLPKRLSFGFALLFMSVATTMLAFASTIFLVIRLDERRRWTTTLICCAAFFPVSVLALTHFPLFVSFINAWKSMFDIIWSALPCYSRIDYKARWNQIKMFFNGGERNKTT